MPDRRRPPNPPRPIPERPDDAPVPGPAGPRTPYPVNDPGIADPGMPVGMLAEDGSRQGPVGEGRGLRAHLPQAIETQGANSLDVAVGEAWADQQIGEQTLQMIQ